MEEAETSLCPSSWDVEMYQELVGTLETPHPGKFG
jgi:hypothetical protein